MACFSVTETKKHVFMGARLCAQSFSCVQLFGTLWTVANQAPLS